MPLKPPPGSKGIGLGRKDASIEITPETRLFSETDVDRMAGVLYDLISLDWCGWNGKWCDLEPGDEELREQWRGYARIVLNHVGMPADPNHPWNV